VRSGKATKNDHPSLQALALYSNGDLPWLMRLKLGGHVRNCARCEEQVARFRSARKELNREAGTQTLTGFESITDWTRLEREMLGNIAVGVAAARCIDNVRTSRTLVWRAAGASVGLAILFFTGWFANIPSDKKEHLTASIRRSIGIESPQITGSVVETTPQGIAVRTQGATLTILHPPSAVVSLAGSSSLGARFVDEQTGQVTITNVYGQ